MADRNADYMYNNGGVWDRMFFKTTANQVIGEPILGLSYNADIMVTTNGQSILGPYAYQGFVSDTYYASAGAASTITIKKTGIYALFSNFQISDRTAEREQVEIYPEINGVMKPFLFAPSRSNPGNTQSIYVGNKILKLQQNDTIKIRLNGMVANFNMRIDAGTYFVLYPVSLN